MTNNTHEITARITAVHKERYEISCENGLAHARLKTAVYFNGGEELFPTVGDFVQILFNSNGDSLITKTLPRKTSFSRRDPDKGRGEQAVAANFDVVFILQSLNHDFNAKRLERYITIAFESGATPVILLTKADLAEDCQAQIHAAAQVAAGVNIHAVSAKTGAGLEELAGYLKPGKTIVLLGSSGVGKSSLVNALAGEDIMAVSGIREDDSRGRHTTTHRQLITFKSGVMVIDTPGMREIGMWEVDSGLDEVFSDVEAYLGQCRFSDCRHEAEPGCAVRAAVEDGRLAAERFKSYQRLKKESQYAKNKAAAMRLKRERNKAAARWSKQEKKNRR